MVNKLLTNVLLIAALALAGLWVLSAVMPAHPAAVVDAHSANKTSSTAPLNNAGTTIISQPHLSATFINQVLAAYGSPAAGQGQALYDLGQKYQINSDFALAFFGHESTFGLHGEARSSLSLGNLRCISTGYEDLSPSCKDDYAWFPSWKAGFEAFYRLLRHLYVDTWHLTTLPDIIHRFAPAADHNDEVGYVRELTFFLSTWYEGKVQA